MQMCLNQYKDGEQGFEKKFLMLSRPNAGIKVNPGHKESVFLGTKFRFHWLKFKLSLALLFANF